LQRAFENQDTEHLPRVNAAGPEESFSAPAAISGFAHDFSRISLHSKAPASLQAKPAIETAKGTDKQAAGEASARVHQAEQQDQKQARLHSKSAALSQSGQVAAPPAVNKALASPGQPLDRATRSFLEPRFGYDFSQVRVHSGELARHSAESLNAKAYTVGRNIFFGANRFAPGTPDGQRLLAHELAHVVQQGRGGTPHLSLDGKGPLEQAADHAATQAVAGVGPVAVRGAAAPAPMCQPDEPTPEPVTQGDAEEDDGGQASTRQLDKRRTQQRKRERATAGRQEAHLTQAQAEQELLALEESYRQPGAQTRSLRRKTADLRRYEKLLELAAGTPLEKNMRKGAFDELQRTPSTTAGKPQTKYVAGGPQLPGQELRPGRESYAQPDYPIYRRRADGSLERIHVNLKSDKIDTQTIAGARATARAYLKQAIKNSRHLPEGESIVISFARTPSADVQQAMQEELFVKGSPVSEVRFGTTTHRRENYIPPAAPKQTATTKRKTPKATKRKAPKATTPKPKRAPKTTAHAARPAVKPATARPTARPATVKPTAVKPAAVKPTAVKPTAITPRAVRPTPAKPQTVRPVVPKTTVNVTVPKSASPGRSLRVPEGHGRGVGFLISWGASLIASKAQASVEEDRFTQGYSVDIQAIEREVNQKLMDMSYLFVEHHVQHPGTPLYANVTIYVQTFEGYVVAGDEPITWTDYYGTFLDGIELGTEPLEKTRVVRDGSASRGGADVYRYTTYPVELASPPIDELVTYAKLRGMDLRALRPQAVAERDAVSRDEGGRVAAHMHAHWSDVISLIDADDTDLMLRAQTEKLPFEEVRSYLDLKAERIEMSIGTGAYPQQQGAIYRLVTEAEKARELSALMDAPFDAIVDYAKKNGKQLDELRVYAVRRAAQAGKASDADADSAYWSQIVRYIDSL
jgi:hypothetical protein